MGKRILLAMVFIAMGVINTYAQDAKYKALFIYNFTKHIEWPANAKTGDFVIGVVGNNDVFNNISNIAGGKKAGSQNIVVVKFKSVEEVIDCHILFVGMGQSNSSKFAIIQTKTSGKNTLIVTERAGMAKKGSVINFVVQGGKIKFELNKANAAKYKLTISSYLENLAIVI